MSYYPTRRFIPGKNLVINPNIQPDMLNDYERGFINVPSFSSPSSYASSPNLRHVNSHYRDYEDDAIEVPFENYPMPSNRWESNLVREIPIICDNISTKPSSFQSFKKPQTYEIPVEHDENDSARFNCRAPNYFGDNFNENNSQSLYHDSSPKMYFGSPPIHNPHFKHHIGNHYNPCHYRSTLPSHPQPHYSKSASSSPKVKHKNYDQHNYGSPKYQTNLYPKQSPSPPRDIEKARKYRDYDEGNNIEKLHDMPSLSKVVEIPIITTANNNNKYTSQTIQDNKHIDTDVDMVNKNDSKNTKSVAREIPISFIDSKNHSTYDNNWEDKYEHESNQFPPKTPSSSTLKEKINQPDKHGIHKNEHLVEDLPTSQRKPRSRSSLGKKADDSEEIPQRSSSTSPPRKIEETPQEIVSSINRHIDEEIVPAIDKLKNSDRSTKLDRKNKDYLVLDDALTKYLLKLDGIEAGEDDEVRKLRRDMVHKVNDYINILENLVSHQPTIQKESPSTQNEELESNNEVTAEESPTSETEMKSNPSRGSSPKGRKSPRSRRRNRNKHKNQNKDHDTNSKDGKPRSTSPVEMDTSHK